VTRPHEDRFGQVTAHPEVIRIIDEFRTYSDRVPGPDEHHVKWPPLNGDNSLALPNRFHTKNFSISPNYFAEFVIYSPDIRKRIWGSSINITRRGTHE